MNTSVFQPGMMCLRMAANAPTRSAGLSMHFSSMTRGRLHLLRQQQQVSIKSASTPRFTSTVSSAAPSSATAASASPAGTPNASMPWEEYFKLRKSRRTWGTVAAIPTTLAGCMVGGGYFANLQAQPNELIFGIEPIYVYGIAILGCVTVGWLSGPMLGNALWKLRHRSVLAKVEHMDTVFLHHIKARRVDPSRQSVNNPVPDYYGEKIGSMKGYRQWLRDQATYRRKAAFGAPDL